MIISEYDLDLRRPLTPLFAHHGIGVRATEILSCLDLPYQAIDTFRKEELQSGNGLALFIFTDDAEIYIKEIDACIQQYKDIFRAFFVLDFHPNPLYAKYKARWEHYNIFTTQYCSLHDNLQHYLWFFKHFIDDSGLMAMDFNDFRWFSRQSTFITAGTSPSIANPIHPVMIDNHLQILMIGIELQAQDEGLKELDTLTTFVGKLSIQQEMKWQVSAKVGHLHTEYVVSFEANSIGQRG